MIEVGDGSAFASAAHLAAHLGIAPVTRKSGSSIRGEHPARSGNKKLERALFGVRVLRPPLTPPVAPTTTRNGGEKKKHNAARICLARRRCDVLYAMLNSTKHRSPQRLDGDHRDTTGGSTSHRIDFQDLTDH